MPAHEDLQHPCQGLQRPCLTERIGYFTLEEIRLAGLSCVFDTELLCDSVKLLPITGTLHDLLSDPSLRYLLIDLSGETEKRRFLETIHHARTDIRLIVIGPADDELALMALRAGAKAYIDLAAPIELIRKAIQTVAGGSIWASRAHLSLMLDRLLATVASRDRHPAPRLTHRESQVLDLILSAHSNREIAKQLGIDERTVKAHVGRLMRKTGAENRVGLTVRALDQANNLPPGLLERRQEERRSSERRRGDTLRPFLTEK